MTALTSARILKGRRALKNASAEARQIATIQTDEEAAAARAQLRFHYGLKTRNLGSLVINASGEGGFVALLILDDCPIGMPNVIGSVICENEDDAKRAGLGLLVCAWRMILDYKEEIALGTADVLRRFEYGDFAIGVPGEIMNVVANRTTLPKDQDRRTEEVTRYKAALISLLGSQMPDEATWAKISDEVQVEIMVEAARLLCFGVNRIPLAA